MRATLSVGDLTALVQLACLLEASAPKPGNVSPGRPFADTRYEDFVASAVAAGPVLGCAASRPLGATVRLAVEATSRWTSRNTNLGIILLLTPIARAAAAGSSALRAGVRAQLEETTIDDARDVYAAIRLARPGGLGRAESQDVGDEPTVTLLDTMRLAAHRDAIANEYVTGFDTTFTVGVPALASARRDRLSWDDAVVHTYLRLLAHSRDTHIERRAGTGVAAAVSARARHVLELGGVRTHEGRRALDEMDGALRDPHNSLNPGATADLTAAAILAVLIENGWHGEAGST